MRKLLLLLLTLGALAIWVRSTAQFAYWNLRQALEAGDVTAAEQYADLPALAKAAVDVLTSSGEQLADEAGPLAGLLARVVGSVVGAPLKEAIGPTALQELKGAIGRKELAHGVGDFTFDSPLAGLTRTQTFGSSAQVEVTGTCKGQSAAVKVVFERPSSSLPGFLLTYRAVAVERDSLKALAKSCVLTHR